MGPVCVVRGEKAFRGGKGSLPLFIASSVTKT